MKIAYVSFEYPPDTAVGGIATYVFQVARMMKSRGHQVEVFCASPFRSGAEDTDGILVHRILTENPYSFPKEVLPVFKARHKHVHFDIFESPEYNGDGYEIKKQFPSLPLVVKLHTPTSLILELNTFYKRNTLSLYSKFRYLFGGWIRGERREIYWNYRKWKKKEEDIDFSITSIADQIHTPSISLGDIVSAKWGIQRNRILNVPYPFIPDNRYLNIPIGIDKKNITFIGRLEIRKGLIELTKAIPAIFEAVPEAQFRFIGKVEHSIVPGLTMKEYIEKELERYQDRISFLKVTPSEIPDVLKETDVCVFPSLWENFPNVCLEAMSAGRAIVASKEGGMKDMLEDVNAGLLINPLNPKEIAEAIIKLLKNRDLRVEMGREAREKTLIAYNSKVIGDLMEKHYSEAIRQKIN